jgi:hypothetical protein
VNFFQRFKQGLFTKAQVLTGITITMVTTSALVYAYQILSLYTFTAGDTIKSQEINDNFSQINDLLSRSNNTFEVGLTANQSVASTANVYSLMDPLNINTVYSDYTEHGYGTALNNNGSFTLQENGLYRILVHSKVASGGGGYIRIYKANGTYTLGSVYLSSASSTIGYNHMEVFLEQDEVIEFRTQTYSLSGMEIDGAKTKVIFKKLQ